MRRIVSPWGLVAGVVVAVVTNAVILSMAAANRRGEPRARLALTERELAVPLYREKEDSALRVRLVLGQEPPPAARAIDSWRREELPREDPAWLDSAKLRELGFRVDGDPSGERAIELCRFAYPRLVFLVLELEGDAWKRWIARREEDVAKLRADVARGAAEASRLADAEKLLEIDRTMRSRLFAIDAGLNDEALRGRYEDPSRYAIVAGYVIPRLRSAKNGPPTLTGWIENLVVSEVSVPLGLKARLTPFLAAETQAEWLEKRRKETEHAWPAPVPPRYRATVAWGRRDEPWLVDVSAIEPGPGGSTPAPSGARATERGGT